MEVKDGAAFAFVGAIVGWLGHVATEYLKTRGKNRADREDVPGITALIEAVKHGNSIALEQVRGTHQLRLAAIDRRLEVHQEGYSLWRKLIFAIRDESIHEVVHQSETWWEASCLYLTADAPEAFRIAYISAHQHPGILRGPANADQARLATENMNRVRAAGLLLVSGVGLPDIGAGEGEAVI